MGDKLSQGSTHVPPGTLRSAAWHRGDTEPGDRLYRDAERRQAKLEQLQAEQERRQQEEESQVATFRPDIHQAQRRCQGIGKSMRDPEGLKTKTKIENLRHIRSASELDGCTFRPEIDARSIIRILMILLLLLLLLLLLMIMIMMIVNIIHIRYNML